ARAVLGRRRLGPPGDRARPGVLLEVVAAAALRLAAGAKRQAGSAELGERALDKSRRRPGESLVGVGRPRTAADGPARGLDRQCRQADDDMPITPSQRPTREWPLLVLTLALVGTLSFLLWQWFGGHEMGGEGLSAWNRERVGRLLIGPEQIACYACFTWAAF